MPTVQLPSIPKPHVSGLQRPGQKPTLPFKKMTDAKLQAKKDRGLCFRCDEKYSFGHRCKNKELHILMVNDKIDVAESDEAEREEDVDNAEEIYETVELSINSIVGLTTPKTMKVSGSIGQQEVVVMIDCGATHNFISVALVEKLGIPKVGTNC